MLSGKFPFIHRVEERATVNMPTATLEDWFASGYDTAVAGVNVTENTALKLSAYWRGVNLLSSQIASFPIGLFRRTSDGTSEVKDHPAVRLLTRQPNGVMAPFIWRESMQANVLTKGNGYSYIQRNALGEPLELRIMDPGPMEPKTDGLSLAYEYDRKTYNPYYILHIPGLSFDGIKGKAILEAAAESMGIGLAMQKYSASVFKNGAKQTGVLMHPHQLSDTARQGMRKSFDKTMKGEEGGTIILDENMKWQPTAFSPAETQLIESKQFSVQDLARWFGIPPHLLFEESRSTFNNIESQGLEFVRYTLTQWVERWEAELNRKLLTEKERDDHFFKMNMGSLMRGDMGSRYAAYSIGVEKGWLSPNEVRRWEDLNKIGGGDTYTQQINKAPLGKTEE